jgi:hypothetical protein
MHRVRLHSTRIGTRKSGAVWAKELVFAGKTLAWAVEDELAKAEKQGHAKSSFSIIWATADEEARRREQRRGAGRERRRRAAEARESFSTVSVFS